MKGRRSCCKNWATKTAQVIKRLKSRYAFVLTGASIENRIDELYSIIDFLDPSILGTLFGQNISMGIEEMRDKSPALPPGTPI